MRKRIKKKRRKKELAAFVRSFKFWYPIWNRIYDKVLLDVFLKGQATIEVTEDGVSYVAHS